jgi:tRNA G46 methylase TrmB
MMLPLLRPNTVLAAYYLLPNPPENYCQERANRRRRNFLQSVYDALVPGGRFFFATDSDEFFRCLDEILKNDLHCEPLSIENADISTGYWRLWEDNGRSVKGLAVEKRA